MELVLNDEQRLLRESAEKLVARIGGPDAHRASRDSKDGFDRARHKQIAEAGWLSLLAPERDGGLGLGMTELALVLEQAGRALMSEPVAATAIAAYAIGAGKSATGADEMLAGLMAGERIILPAIRDPDLPDDEGEALRANPYHYGYQVTGTRRGVPLAGAADGFLIDPAMSDGRIVMVMPADLFGVDVEARAAVDGGTSATVSFADASMMDDGLLIGSVNQGATLAAEIYDRLLIATAAEMLGVMEAALDMALDYMKTREQFGRKIGSFQALQHRAVNAHIERELTRSFLYQVCAAMDAKRATRAMAAAVKAHASDAVLEVVKAAVQIHGAIGFTDEHDVGLYMRRAMALAVRYGDAGFHRRRYAALSEIEAAAADGGGAPRRRKRAKRKKSIFAQ